MARPVTISDEQILEAAREVFLEHGVRGTTQEVAARAGVSEGILFKRFKSKDALFRASMTHGSVDAVGWVSTLHARVGKGELREQLFEIGMAIARFFEQIVALHMHSWAGRSPEDTSSPFGDFAEPPPLTARKRFAAYLDAERKLGRIGRGDPDVIARTFLGALYSFVALDMMMAGHDPKPMPKTTFVRGLVDTILDGAAPSDPPARTRPLRRRAR